MKKLLLFLLVTFVSTSLLYSQNYLLLYRQNYETPIAIPITEIDSISQYDVNVQIIATKKEIIKTNISQIDSLVFASINLCSDNNHPHAIDLGLPSGVVWSCCNVGAIVPEEYGGYYAWGETEEKDVYNDVTYMYASGLDEDDDGKYDDFNENAGHFGTWRYIGYNISNTEYDVAHVKWGGLWRMPSKKQTEELYNNCTSMWTTLNGVNGRFVIGPNGNTLFLPAAGRRWNDELAYDGDYAFYWSSSPIYAEHYEAICLDFSIYYWKRYWYRRSYGQSVRAVIVPEPVLQVAEAIDLGLPSGTKWASWNVGATKPEEYGGYYAWGETEEKEYYNWLSYSHCDGSEETCHNIGDEIAGTEYDVAHVKWGGSWRMPSDDQIRELWDNCIYTWTTRNGVIGALVTGPNGNTIFLPAAGDRWNNYLYANGEKGYYWSSSHWKNDSGHVAVYILFSSSYSGWGDCYARGRCWGFPVRPVCK